MDLSSANARQLLDRAESTTRHAAHFYYAWLCYIALCTGGAITASGLAYANVTGAARLPAWIAGGMWIVVGVIFTASAGAVSPASRRGLTTRWTTFIILWVILWVVVSFFNAYFTLGHGIALSGGFLALATLGPLWEIVALNRAGKQL